MSNLPKPIGRSPYDDKIIQGFANLNSAEDVSRSIDGALTPEQCLARVKKLIKAKDTLDAKELLALNLDDAYFLRGRLRSQMENSKYIDDKAAEAWLKTLEAIAGRLEKANLALEEQMLRFNEKRAFEMVQALTYIFEQIYPVLESKGVERPDAEMIILEAIPESLPEIE